MQPKVQSTSVKLNIEIILQRYGAPSDVSDEENSSDDAEFQKD